ncbi:MAG: metallophosphoesterase [Myxococcales bacterium]|nr:metallophosphoesterase [Myxococcota bacterium]MDW8283251.1 metallophosphoesterase [Myxococcales bacterium]
MHPGAAQAVLLGGVLLCLGATPVAAEEFIYLGFGPVLGDRARELRTLSAPPAGWTGPDFDDSSWSLPAQGPAGPPDGGSACGGTLYLRRRFDVGPELSRLASLALRLRAEDGFAAYLNGTEVARRRLPEAALCDATTLATDRSSGEVETVWIPLSRGTLRPQDNLLALEVHPARPERCARVDAELSAADGARIVRGPYIEHLTEESVDIAVESDVPTQLEVRYGRGPSRSERDRRVADRTLATVHRLHLSGLRAATTYHYQISLRLPTGAVTDLPETAFHTPPRAGRPLRFVVYGDSRSGHAVHAQIVQSILVEDPDLVLHTGDAVERGTEEADWDRFFQVAGPLLRQVPVYLVPGNHEYARRGQGAQRLFDLFSTMFVPQSVRPGVAREGMQLPGMAPPTGEETGERGYYSFDVAGVHFVALDSNQYRSPRQMAWLEQDLARAAARRPRALFVWTHDGPYSNGWHGGNTDAQRLYVPLLERYGVTMLFSGHDHNYERGQHGALSYLVTGGGGAELRPLRCGVAGKRRCKHPFASFINDHHYVRVEVLPGLLRICPKRIDGTPLEPCHTSRLPR